MSTISYIANLSQYHHFPIGVDFESWLVVFDYLAGAIDYFLVAFQLGNNLFLYFKWG